MSEPPNDLRRLVEDLRALDGRLATGPRVTEAAIAEVEAVHGIRLPEAYRAALSEVGDGVQWPFPRFRRVLVLADALRLSRDLSAPFPADAVAAGTASIHPPGCLSLGYGQALVVTGEERGAIWLVEVVEPGPGTRAAPSFDAYLGALLSNAIAATKAAREQLEAILADACATRDRRRRRAPGERERETAAAIAAHARLGGFLADRGRDLPRAITLLETAFAAGSRDAAATRVLLDAYRQRAQWGALAAFAARRFRETRAEPTRNRARDLAALLAALAEAAGRSGHLHEAALLARASLGLDFHHGVLAMLGALFVSIGFEERGRRELARSGQEPPVFEPVAPILDLPREAALAARDGFVRRADPLPPATPDRPSRRVLNGRALPREQPGRTAVHSDEVDAYEREHGSTLPPLYREDLLRVGSVGLWRPQIDRLPGERLGADAVVFEGRADPDGRGGLLLGVDPTDGQRVVLVDRGPQRESIWKWDDQLEAFLLQRPELRPLPRPTRDPRDAWRDQRRGLTSRSFASRAPGDWRATSRMKTSTDPECASMSRSAARSHSSSVRR